MSGISIGLKFNKPAAKKGAPPKTTKPKASVFGAEDDDDLEADIPDEGVFAKKGAKSKKAKEALAKDLAKKKDINRVNVQLATFNEISKKAEEEKAKALQEVDPSVFDYDAAYDAIQEARDLKKKEKEVESEERKPKYIEAFMQSAETRRKDFLRAKEKMLEKEREAEGDDFAGKEVFVTEAYKKQKEELKRLEELEIQREEKEKKKSQGVASFYRNLLDQQEAEHQAMMKAAENAKARALNPEPVPDDNVPKAKPVEEKVKEIKEKYGENVEVNDEGEVVDKRQLLKGGLNILEVRRTEKKQMAAEQAKKNKERLMDPEKLKTRNAMRERHTKLLEQQLEQAQKRSIDEVAEQEAELAARAKSRKTTTDVMSAKERYLQRKREAEEAKKKQATG
ncbi:hypothetical protein BJ508DRAFT_411679 [Ascobolus immersus RN42]|uniref:Nuclear speckle splicing regulatory protein 1 N-terminal domain-containing protein n=1 Tax=Ascobolus immersus RN42 TaxID=1160509 RepID=A0A3N4IIK1_ASCIM|nr:hypothetical protein BJ508DRAFT_411679 [Ascobolus immersus RN42]